MTTDDDARDLDEREVDEIHSATERHIEKLARTWGKSRLALLGCQSEANGLTIFLWEN